MLKGTGWVVAALATALILVGGGLAAQSFLDDGGSSTEDGAASVVGLDVGDVVLDLGVLDRTAALDSCATPGFVAGDPEGIEVLYGVRQLSAVEPIGSFILRNADGKLMFCDMFGEDRPAIQPLPSATDATPAVLLTNTRRDWTCAGAAGAELVTVRTNLWLEVNGTVESARTRFWVDGTPGPWFGSAPQGGYLHLQSWLTSTPVGGTLKLETQVLDGAGERVAVPGMPAGPRALLVSCGVQLG